jgi:4-hydroxy-4-methyl-2-oxoglutarate aldolase
MTLRMHGLTSLAAAALFASAFTPTPAKAQLWTWTKDQMVDYTKAWTGDRFDDGRPKVPDAWLTRAKGMSSEEVTIPGGRGGGQGYSQYDGDFKVLHPELKMAGRVVTVSFMPPRADLDAVVNAKAREKNISLGQQYVIDMLQPGDVLVVDLFGKKENAGIVGDNLFYYINKVTKGGGLVLEGSFRDLDGIAEIGLPCYYRDVHPSYLNAASAVVAAINVPIRIGEVTVMPGDLAVGDKEGVNFIPPQNALQILDAADTTHIHDDWTKKMFDTGKYKSTDIYPNPRTPELRQQLQDYIKTHLDEIHAKQPK